ncbi:hypothetical protein ACTXT7_005133 [Hymenolepis weldensis]
MTRATSRNACLLFAIAERRLFKSRLFVMLVMIFANQSVTLKDPVVAIFFAHSTCHQSVIEREQKWQQQMVVWGATTINHTYFLLPPFLSLRCAYAPFHFLLTQFPPSSSFLIYRANFNQPLSVLRNAFVRQSCQQDNSLLISVTDSEDLLDKRLRRNENGEKILVPNQSSASIESDLILIPTPNSPTSVPPTPYQQFLVPRLFDLFGRNGSSTPQTDTNVCTGPTGVID